jgi:enoyl-CoA hydratase
MGLNETAIGLALPRGAFEIARSALAPQHLGRLVLEGGLYGPEQAKELGYIHELVEPEALSARCLVVARGLAAHPQQAYAHNKALIREPYVTACERETAEMRQRLIKIWGSDETREAFLRRAAAVKKR